MAIPEYLEEYKKESEERHEEYHSWLKRTEAESKARRKAFVASNRAYAKTIGRSPGDPIYDKYMKLYEELRSNDGFGAHPELPLNKQTRG